MANKKPETINNLYKSLFTQKITSLRNDLEETATTCHSYTKNFFEERAQHIFTHLEQKELSKKITLLSYKRGEWFLESLENIMEEIYARLMLMYQLRARMPLIQWQETKRSIILFRNKIYSYYEKLKNLLDYTNKKRLTSIKKRINKILLDAYNMGRVI